MKERAERYRVSFRIVWDDGESYFAGAVSNISETGLYLETSMPLGVGKAITILPLDVDGKDGGLFELHGKIVRSLSGSDLPEGAFAVQFDALRPDALEDLRAMLRKYSIS